MNPNNLLSIDTAAGTITLGSTVRSTRYADVQGPVTAIRRQPGGASIEVSGRHSDFSQYYQLLAPPCPQAQEIFTQALVPVLSGRFELRLPGDGDRIYFAETAEQVLALLDLRIGLSHDFREQDLRAVAGTETSERGDEVRFRGTYGGVGQLAYVRRGQPRPAPAYAVGNRVCFYSSTVATISGIRLYADDRRQYGATTWFYEYAEAPSGSMYPMSELHTSLAA